MDGEVSSAVTCIMQLQCTFNSSKMSVIFPFHALGISFSLVLVSGKTKKVVNKMEEVQAT